MTASAYTSVNGRTLPNGVVGVHALPADHHDGPWDSVVTPPGVKERLLGTALLTMMHSCRLAGLSSRPSGLIVLAGPPGTGKTTLAQGLAQRAALAVSGRGATTFAEIDPHAMPSEMLGESQRNVVRLMRDADAVLAGLDHLAAAVPGAVVVTTTNFLTAVDEAFLSRADLVVELGLPDEETRAKTLSMALADLAVLRPELQDLAADTLLHASRADATKDWDGRRLRKLPLSVIGADPELARDPGSSPDSGSRMAPWPSSRGEKSTGALPAA